MLLYLIYISVFLILLSVAWASFSLAPWVPTRKKDLERIKRLANLEPGEIFYDLGSGDGRVAIYLSKHTKGKVVGLELAIPFYLICKIRGFTSKNRNLSFKYKNLYKEDLRTADVIYIFAESEERLASKLEQKLNNELKPGARAITYAFPIKGWQPIIVDKPGEDDISIYLYKK